MGSNSVSQQGRKYRESQHQTTERMHMPLTSPCNGDRHHCNLVCSLVLICIWLLFFPLAPAQWPKSCFPWVNGVLWLLTSKIELRDMKQVPYSSLEYGIWLLRHSLRWNVFQKLKKQLLPCP
jgi:hypothetical protein